jgi:hypothetical protein
MKLGVYMQGSIMDDVAIVIRAPLTCSCKHINSIVKLVVPIMASYPYPLWLATISSLTPNAHGIHILDDE